VAITYEPLADQDGATDKPQVEARWVFVRGNQRLELTRATLPDCVQLVVTLSGEPRRVHTFPDLLTLTRFQSDMEQVLVWTGWTFVEFSPDRRTGRERRKWPRLEERRRWWTDARQATPAPGSDSPAVRKRSRRRR
jgi:hypothetical protein